MSSKPATKLCFLRAVWTGSSKDQQIAERGNMTFTSQQPIILQ